MSTRSHLPPPSEHSLKLDITHKPVDYNHTYCNVLSLYFCRNSRSPTLISSSTRLLSLECFIVESLLLSASPSIPLARHPLVGLWKDECDAPKLRQNIQIQLPPGDENQQISKLWNLKHHTRQQPRTKHLRHHIRTDFIVIWRVTATSETNVAQQQPPRSHHIPRLSSSSQSVSAPQRNSNNHQPPTDRIQSVRCYYRQQHRIQDIKRLPAPLQLL